jgi:uncharacterized phiE125 gp8 family phage protein
MAVKIITGPTIEPVTLAEAKAQCRVEADQHDEDALIAGYIKGAREWCEKMDWRAYCTQTLEMWLDDWPQGDKFYVQRPPLQSVTYVKYYDLNNAEYTLATTAYIVDTVNQPGRIALRTRQAVWPLPSSSLREINAIVVKYVAGYATQADVPQRVKQAILLIIGQWNENREAAISGTISREIDFGVRNLLGIDRAMRF